MNIEKYILVLIILLGLSGCYQVTEGDLYEEYVPKIVIEAQINNLAPPYFVKVSYSAPPDESVDFYPVSDAEVFISDDNGNTDYLKKISSNTYAAYDLQGTPNVEYSLNIFVDNQEYTSHDIMPEPATIYRTEVKYIHQFVPEIGNYIKLFIDKKINTRFYKLDIMKNDTLYNDYSDLIIFDDAYAEDTVVYLVPYAFEAGDSVVVDLNVITEDIYRYYYALKKQTTNTFSNIQTPLKNPPANIGNQSLGFFQVSSITRLNIVIVDSLQYQ